MATVIINGKSYGMNFSLRVFRALGRKWNLGSLPETMDRVSVMEKMGDGDLNAYDVFYDIIFMAIESCAENIEKITIEEIEDLPVSELLVLSEKMTAGIEEAFKTQSAEEKKIPAPKKEK